MTVDAIQEFDPMESLLSDDPSFGLPFPAVEPWIHLLTGMIDLVVIAILSIGAARFLYWIVRGEISSGSGDLRLERQNLARLELARYILAGLELLIVADVIRTAISFRLEGLIFLGGLVLIRSAISWFLDREIANIERKRQHDAPR
ncbi:DUF1622 domain-containing protein [Mesorhizobium sp. CAU 1741]|uniref:DUF1622 domain-containing protein n=1 Tax=Mesorhizobium sp. CAU 1741 TaxID=3140366 RepID=UPI00325B3A27